MSGRRSRGPWSADLEVGTRRADAQSASAIVGASLPRPGGVKPPLRHTPGPGGAPAPGGIGVKITLRVPEKPAKRALSSSPRRASRGITRPPQYSFSPVGAPSGHADIAPTGLKIFRFRHTFPWLARHGLNDHATPWLNTLRGPAPLIQARDRGFAGILEVILTPMRGSGHRDRWRGVQAATRTNCFIVL